MSRPPEPPGRPRRPSIAYWFVVRRVPIGTAPLEIKEQWVDVPLPCRHPRGEGPQSFLATDVGGGVETMHRVADGVAIDTDDAIKALSLFGRSEAAEWWAERSGLVGSALLFRAYEGDLVPPGLAERLLPGIDDFDRL